MIIGLWKVYVDAKWLREPRNTSFVSLVFKVFVQFTVRSLKRTDWEINESM